VTSTRLLAATLALCASVAAGCGLGPGKDEGDIGLTVTRDYGTNVMLEKTDSIRESDTVMRVLDRNADISTRYGGGFIQSIDGLAGGQSGGRRSDWFFYVNGIESSIGAAQYDPSGGDRIWWDYRDWTAAMRVPAVVGSWPEPFEHGLQGNHWTTTVDCAGRQAACQTATNRLHAAGIATTPPVVVERGGDGDISRTITRIGGIRVLVGAWNALRADPVGKLVGEAPDQSGVFARFVNSASRPLLELLNQQGQPAGSIGKGGGLIAALRPGDGPPTWVVTGTDAKGVAAAANLLGDQLRNRYALATQPGAGAIGVPVP
jgi:Domain of unknown function (DUF4430)